MNSFEPIIEHSKEWVCSQKHFFEWVYTFECFFEHFFGRSNSLRTYLDVGAAWLEQPRLDLVGLAELSHGEGDVGGRTIHEEDDG